jgi:hypothetical protein
MESWGFLTSHARVMHTKARGVAGQESGPPRISGPQTIKKLLEIYC